MDVQLMPVPKSADSIPVPDNAAVELMSELPVTAV